MPTETTMDSTRPRHRSAIFVALSVLLAGQNSSVAVAPRLTNILPPGGQRGTEVPVIFSGQRLGDTREVVFYHDGLSAAQLEAGTNQVKVTLRIAPDCRMGEHQIRLRTATGISDVRTFWVGALTNLAEIEPNSDRAKAQRLPLNCTVHGAIGSEDIDYFLVAAEKGERLSAEIEGMRLGRGAFDPFIAIFDASGQLLASADDSALGFQDGIVAIVAPTSGDYVVQVRESSYGGQEGFHYRLHLGTFPRPTAVLPAAIQAGKPARLRFIGDLRGDFEQTIEAPKTPLDKLGVFALAPSAAEKGLAGSEVAPTPNWLRVVPFPVSLEIEPNDTREQAGPAKEVPFAFSGSIARPGDLDSVRFHARKGQSLQLTVYARRLRSPLDSFLQVANAKGSVIVDSDDAAGPDSSLTFKPDEDGDYFAQIRDHLRRGGPDFTYDLEIAPVESSLGVKFPEVARNDTQSRQSIAVPQGNHLATLVSLKRTAAPGDLRLQIENLPPGLRLLTTNIPAKVDQFPIVFAADPEAAVDGRLAHLVASNTNGVSGHYQNDIELVQGPNNTSYYNTRVDRLAAAVTERAPFALRVIEPKVPLVQGGSMELQIVAERDPGFTEAINVQVLWRPPGISALPDMTIPKGSNHVRYVLNAKADADLQRWPLIVLGSAKVRDGDLFLSSPPATFEVGEPFLAATIEKAACEPGQSTNVVVKLDQRISFEGKAVIRLVGLSEKVTAAEKTITAADREVVFPIKVDASCQPGSQRNLFCAVDIPKNGALIPHSVGQGGVFRVLPPRKPVADAGQKKVASR